MGDSFQVVLAEVATVCKANASILDPIPSRILAVHESPSEEGDSGKQQRVPDERGPSHLFTSRTKEIPCFFKRKILTRVGFLAESQ